MKGASWPLWCFLSTILILFHCAVLNCRWSSSFTCPWWGHCCFTWLSLCWWTPWSGSQMLIPSPCTMRRRMRWGCAAGVCRVHVGSCGHGGDRVVGWQENCWQGIRVTSCLSPLIQCETSTVAFWALATGKHVYSNLSRSCWSTSKYSKYKLCVTSPREDLSSGAGRDFLTKCPEFGMSV